VVWRLSTFSCSWSLTITGLNHFILFNHTHKTKNGITNRWETTNSKPLGLVNHKHGAPITLYLLHFFLIDVRIYCALYHPQQIVQQCCAITFFVENWHVLIFFIHFLFSRSYIRHRRRCSKMNYHFKSNFQLLQPTQLNIMRWII
jgi:hypothetical protein